MKPGALYGTVHWADLGPGKDLGKVREAEGMATSGGHGESFGGGPASRVPVSLDGRVAQTSGRQLNGRFAPGNRLSWQHGKRSTAAIERRAAGAAGRKAAAWVLVMIGSPTRIRPRPIRPDQTHYFNPGELAMMARLAVPGVVTAAVTDARQGGLPGRG